MHESRHTSRELVIDRPGLVVPVRRDLDGITGPTKSEVRSKLWRRSSRGLYVPSAVDPDVVEQRIVEAAARVVGRGAVTGWAALRWLGDAWAGGLGPDGSTPLPVPLVIGTHDFRPQPGLLLTGEGYGPRDLVEVDGLFVTTALWSVCFEARYAPDVRQAVTWLDMAAYADLVSQAEVTSFAETLSGWTGVPQLREAVALMDENSWSPRETRTRLFWRIDAGLPTPSTNQPIFDRRGRHIATPDLLDVEAGLAGEYDGAVHLEGGQRRRDRERDELYRQHGLEALTVLAGDFADRDRLARRIEAARSRSRFESPAARTWTAEPPYWWTPTATVEQRRALDADQRATLLGLRLRVG